MKKPLVLAIALVLISATAVFAQRPTPPRPTPSSTHVLPTKTSTRIPAAATRVAPTATRVMPTSTRVVRAPAAVPPYTFVVLKNGTAITGTVTLTIYVHTNAGVGVNGVQVSLELCKTETTLPCDSGWDKRVAGLTDSFDGSDGLVIVPMLIYENALAKITCGTDTKYQSIAYGTTSILVECVQTPTGVIISEIKARRIEPMNEYMDSALILLGLAALVFIGTHRLMK